MGKEAILLRYETDWEKRYEEDFGNRYVGNHGAFQR